MSESSTYIHGTDPLEQQRLDTMNSLINHQCLEQLSPLASKRIIDFGSGMGQLSIAMAGYAGPSGSVLGIERDERQISQARALAIQETGDAQIEFRQGDVHDPPLHQSEWGTFDLAWSRFVLEHVHEPLGVVCHMARAVRDGGEVVLVDDDHELLTLWPSLDGFGDAWRAYMRSYDVLGYDPIIGRKLPRLLSEAGLNPTRAATMHYGACNGEPLFDAYVANIAGVMNSSIHVIEQHELMPVGEYRNAVDALQDWARQPGATLWYVMNLAQGTKPYPT
ncbi:MAG: methyltransferase domain-containing protein [Planctomycetota bacterium]|jgi:SAM-dependent methyltransferase